MFTFLYYLFLLSLTLQAEQTSKGSAPFLDMFDKFGDKEFSQNAVDTRNDESSQDSMATEKVHSQSISHCEEIEYDTCYRISDHEQCGFCVNDKYSEKGYACEYEYVEYTLKSSSNDQEFVYSRTLSPNCVCEGEFITKGQDCPVCSSIVKELLGCAGVQESRDHYVTQVPTKCLKELDITLKTLIGCGFQEQNSSNKQVFIQTGDLDNKRIIFSIYDELVEQNNNFIIEEE